ncbi:HD domain-containing protein [Oceanirhabdus sp. W0125-5]|uniref:HD domain-containing protein n=1 Tax=Oceanirhabdus sp. W0125-5 TaxID=2999116 RepID=UPI0022F33C9C|nr:HD domain-containing protein [Oceanirhabdus sp. W0125-5]WBW95998.1 HD domain-containing protein [Oceanirhabdus sp. W0125-5]
MKRVNSILNNNRYIEEIKKIETYEKNREFCVHNISHFLTMSRILYILSLEEGLNIDKEIVYAVGLLHDIGRGLQYENGTPHEKGSIILAKDILEESGFNKSEIEIINRGILSHRKYNKEGTAFEKLTYRADKLSRECYECSASDECNWSKEDKNIYLKY